MDAFERIAAIIHGNFSEKSEQKYGDLVDYFAESHATPEPWEDRR